MKYWEDGYYYPWGKGVRHYRTDDKNDTAILIENPGFEEPVLEDGGFTLGFSQNEPIPGWTPFDPNGLISGIPGNEGFPTDVGAFNPSSVFYPDEAPEGDNIGYAFAIAEDASPGVFGFTQTLAPVLAANTNYTLQVKVGDPLAVEGFDLTGFPGYRVELLAGGEVLAADRNLLTPEEGTFETSVVTFTTSDYHPRLGENLEIRLLNLREGPGQGVNFDDVQLVVEKANVPSEPEIGVFVVNSTEDIVNPEDGVTTLREAIEAANNQAGTDLIKFDFPDGFQTIELTEGVLEITDDTLIKGLGAGYLTISGADSFRVFSIDSETKVKIKGLTIANGNSIDGGGAISNSGELTVTNSVLRDNRTTEGGGAILNRDTGKLTVKKSIIFGNESDAFGGGITNFGTLKVTQSAISGNKTGGGGGGGIDNRGILAVVRNSIISNNENTGGPAGGLGTMADLRVIDSIVSGNQALNGAGIQNAGGTLTVRGSKILGNYAINNGGGINNSKGPQMDESGSVEVSDSYIRGNRAGSKGGGIYNADGGPFRLSGSLVKKNRAGEDGGGIFNDNSPFALIDSKIRNNRPNNVVGVESFDLAQTLPNGIASGDTTQNSTVLWARSTFPGEVTFEYAKDAYFRTIAGTVTATVTERSQPVKVEITELQPGTEYFYRVTNAAGATATGQFKTAAVLGNKVGLRFGVSGDWRGELSPYPSLSNATERDLAFFVEHGDTIYADIPSPAVLNPDGTRKAQAETLEEYRAKQSEVYGSRLGENAWADLRASISVLATIDDHEVANDFAGGAAAASDPRFGTTEGLINDTQLYENGLQAFQEYNPLRDEFYKDTGSDPRVDGERKLYRFNTYGSDAATFVLDTRSFRDQELPVIDDPSDLLQVKQFLAASFAPNRTMLGHRQLEELKADLLEADGSGITWKFVMVPEPIQNLGVVAASDRFEGYGAERTEILKFIKQNQIDNVVFIAADLHGTVVNNLTYQESPFGPQIPTNAFEITTGSVAFDPPFGSTTAQLGADFGLLTPEQKAFYDSLPVANDSDSLPNDKDDFIKQSINENGLAFLGYEPIGLNNNLSVADGLIDATLLQGDYLATHTFGWTEFDIEPITQKLTVTTYGIEPYSEAELLANSAEILNRVPTIVSQFEVNPSGLSNGLEHRFILE